MRKVLDHLAVIRASGADAESFLQGQLSGDVRQTSPSRAQWTSYNSPKGRVLAVLLLLRDADGFDLVLPRALLEPILKRLRMFVLRAHVKLEARTSTPLAIFGAADSAPAQAMDVAHAGEGRIVRMPGESPRHLHLAAPDSATDPAESGADAWRLADIRAGVPIVFPQTQERFVAQMLNLDQLNGIGFDKGCYTGQEVIARLHYLGQVKRRMFLLEGEGPAPQPGTAVYDQAGDAQAVGEIVDAIADGAGFTASAVLQLAVAESDNLAVDRPQESRLSRAQRHVYS